MEIIEAKKLLTKDFIDRNTRTVTTTYWNFLTTETETVSQTIFSEDDIAFFQNNILYYGFDQNTAIESPQDIQQKKEKQESSTTDTADTNNNNNNNNNNIHSNDQCNAEIECESSSDHDSFESL